MGEVEAKSSAVSLSVHVVESGDVRRNPSAFELNCLFVAGGLKRMER